MKNLFITALLLISCTVMAQNSSTTKSSSTDLKFGLKVGVNFATLTNLDDSATDVSSRIGINIGGYLNYKFADKFAFQPELLYTTQGAETTVNSDGTLIDVNFMLDYLAVPLMVKYYPAKRFNIEFGPQLSFIVSKKLKASANGQSFTYDIDDFFAENGADIKTNTFDLGLNFGFGYELSSGISFNGRYTLGMIKVFKGADMVYTNGDDQIVKNSVFTLGMGYTFK